MLLSPTNQNVLVEKEDEVELATCEKARNDGDRRRGHHPKVADTDCNPCRSVGGGLSRKEAHPANEIVRYLAHGFVVPHVGAHHVHRLDVCQHCHSM